MKKTITILALFLFSGLNAQCWQSVDGGVGHTISLTSDDNLYTWGLANSGQVGNGTTDFSVPEKFEPLPGTTWQSAAAGFWHSAAIKADGTLYVWGNYYSTPETITQLMIPTQIGFNTNWKTADAGIDFTLLLKDDNTLWSFGYNLSGQLGNGTLNNSSYPSQIGTDSWLQISAGLWQSSGIKTNGTLWEWGNTLGLGSSGENSVPTQVGTFTWNSVSSGGTVSAAIKNDGTLWSWGVGGFVGDGTNETSTQPVQIGTAQYLQVSAGCDHILALRTDGTIWSWGENVNGQLGDGTITDRNSPVQVGTATNWIKVISGCDHSYAIDSNNNLYAWGGNFAGALGIGITENLSTPVLVSCPTLALPEITQKNRLVLYPNPAQNFISISNEANVTWDSVSIYDLSGKLITQDLNPQGLIDVSAFASGLYHVKIESGADVVYIKFVKQ